MQAFALRLVTATNERSDNLPAAFLAMTVAGLLAIAVFFLIRSFRKHAKLAAQPWESDQPGTGEPGVDESGTGESEPGQRP